MMHGLSRGMSPVLFASFFETLFIILLFRLYRHNPIKIWLTITVVLCAVFFFFFGFEFSREFTLTSKFSQITLALSMNANLVFGAVVGIFGLPQHSSKEQ